MNDRSSYFYILLEYPFIYKRCKYELYALLYTSTQYVTFGTINILFKIINILVLRLYLALFKIPMHLDTYSRVFAICIFHDSLRLIRTPKNLLENTIYFNIVNVYSIDRFILFI